MPNDVEDVRISEFPISKKKSLVLNQQQSVKNLTIGINALYGISVLELSGLGALERVVVLNGGLSGGSGRLRVTNCTNLIGIDIGKLAFMKYKYLELIDLTRLQTINLGNNAFQMSHSVQFDSKREMELIIRLALTSVHSTWRIRTSRRRQ